jgi:predicted nucleic acid-binding protein
MKQRIYIDTSVIGGYFDDEFSNDTIPFFESVNNGDILIIVSDLLEAELMGAPDFVQKLLTTIFEVNIVRVKLTPEATILADKYIEAKVVGKTSRADCQHIAIATLNKADILISWNFKHIVNIDRIRGYNGINYQNGHNMIEIRTPKEIIKYGTEE